MKVLRWGYLAGLLLFPGIVWLGASAWGHPVSTWVLPGNPHPVGLFILGSIVWVLTALAPLMELRGPITSWRDEVAQWVLYALFAASMSGLFIAWAWGTLVIHRAVLSLLPFLEALAAPLGVLIFFALVVVTLYLVIWMTEHGLTTAFRRFLRYRLLRLSTSNEDLTALLKEVPLPPETKAYYRDRLRGWVSRAVLQELLGEVEALPDPSSPAEKATLLRFIQTLRNRLDEEEFRQWN